MKELLEAGVHFGHQTRRWNPKMKEYIFGERNGIHIIDLQKTLKMFREASRFVSEISAQGRTVLFVGTKRQAQEAVADEKSAEDQAIVDGVEYVDTSKYEQYEKQEGDFVEGAEVAQPFEPGVEAT